MLILDENYLDSNFSFITNEQIFCLCINEENEMALSKIFYGANNFKLFNKFTYFCVNSNNKSKFTNYAKIFF